MPGWKSSPGQFWTAWACSGYTTFSSDILSQNLNHNRFLSHRKRLLQQQFTWSTERWDKSVQRTVPASKVWVLWWKDSTSRIVTRSELRCLPLISWPIGGRLLPNMTQKAFGEVSNCKYIAVSKDLGAHGVWLHVKPPRSDKRLLWFTLLHYYKIPEASCLLGKEA
jgi:hypothetical protein